MIVLAVTGVCRLADNRDVIRRGCERPTYKEAGSP
jgi:hypothetical protein